MQQILRILLLGLSLIMAIPAAQAATPTQELGRCLVDTLNGKERKGLAKWIFFSMAAHPEIAGYANATPAVIEQSDRYVGGLITRLLTDDCPNELRLAHGANPQAIEQAFELVGQVAMQELMNNPAVMRTLTNYSKFADLERIGRTLNPGQ